MDILNIIFSHAWSICRFVDESDAKMCELMLQIILLCNCSSVQFSLILSKSGLDQKSYSANKKGVKFFETQCIYIKLRNSFLYHYMDDRHLYNARVV